ncbi:MAG TPA: carboxypeptidase-like regulatory domain-containing protein, partial [Rhodothermales bacterium]
MRFRVFLSALIALLCCSVLFAQQTGSITGKVTTDNQPLPGVTVEARSNVLPQPRVTTTDANGQYQLPALVPGTYTLTFSLSGMQTVTRKAAVQLSQNTNADVKMGVQGISEQITVTAQ